MSARAYVLGTELRLTWTTTAPAGTVFQIYLDQRLVWHGTQTFTDLPLPRKRVWIDVGTVGPGEDATDFSASLPVPPGGGEHATLTWVGGTFEGADIAGFHVYGSTPPGTTVDYVHPLATIPAYPQDLVIDGFGLGGFGLGGFGTAPSSYSWTSNTLTGGLWFFAVKPFDHAGNEGPAVTMDGFGLGGFGEGGFGEGGVYIAAPPLPPAANASGLRLSANLDSGFGTGGYGLGGFGEGSLVLSWLASPS